MSTAHHDDPGAGTTATGDDRVPGGPDAPASAAPATPATVAPATPAPIVPVPSASTAAPVRHPFDPLTADEIRAAVAAVRLAHPELETGPIGPTFPLVALVDPDKDAVVAHAPGRPIARRAQVVARDRDQRRTYEARVALPTVGTSTVGDGREEVAGPASAEPIGGLADGSAAPAAAPPVTAATVTAWREVEDGCPPIADEDAVAATHAVRADPRFVAALARRGIEDPQLVQIDPLAPGAFPQNPAGRRMIWATPYLRPTPASNPYSRPIENLRAAVDLDTGEVLEVLDGEIVPLSTAAGDYVEPEAVGGWRTDVRPLEIVQPEGVGFRVDGHVVEWQNWRFHAALHPVDGLILGDVRHRDGDRWRQVVHRASLAEMVVPYGDPHDGFYWRTYFDGGDYGIGRLTNSLTLGCDCLGAIRYFDATLSDRAGEPRTIDNAICLHEEDFSILAKHTDPATGEVYVRRARRLVVSNIATVGNYDYGFYWSFYQDGSIELEAKLTGIVLTRGVTPEDELRHAERLAPDLAAPHHQHLFSVRLDMAVDGFDNTVVETDLVASDPGPDNPWGQAIEVRSTPIAREAEGRRFVDPLKARSWKVVNRGRTNHVGQPVGYKLMPHAGPLMLAAEDSSVGRRAGFARAHLWVTRHHPDERHAAGDFPGQHPGGAGLPQWVAQDRELLDTDVVLWHTFGVSHAVRPEDWPIMPVERVGFMLRPVGFFDRAPSVDVPPSPVRHGSVRAGAGDDHCGGGGSGLGAEQRPAGADQDHDCGCGHAA